MNHITAKVEVFKGEVWSDRSWSAEVEINGPKLIKVDGHFWKWTGQKLWTAGKVKNQKLTVLSARTERYSDIKLDGLQGSKWTVWRNETVLIKYHKVSSK